MATSTKQASRSPASRETPSPSPSPKGRKYGPRAEQEVARALHEEKRGQLKSGRSGQTVTDPRQAIAIGLSRARKAGAKVPKANGKT